MVRQPDALPVHLPPDQSRLTGAVGEMRGGGE
jgi:hypothetical protein